MCGIAGYLKTDGSHCSDSEVLSGMLDTIVHRGPDDSGCFKSPTLNMGMRRLSIISIDDGKQPIYDESRRYALVFNGEIYNYLELRRQLEQQGHSFATESDTEVIVHLFEEHGEKCVDHLRGMFAFAIWDTHSEELFIARDRLGIKPLYYVETDQALVFGSEIKSLLKHPEVHARLDVQALSQYLSLKYVPAPRTMFEGIRTLEPGHWLKATQNKIRTKRYWDLSFSKVDEFSNEQTALERLDELLQESIRLRLRADVPFGAFLSGGLDSSLIVALMAQQLSTPVSTFSVGFENAEGEDELPYAQQVANAFGCSHHTIKVTGGDFVKYAESTLSHLDQPIADQATIATYMLSQLASKHVKMVLTGEGGDELFAGYARYAGEQLAPWIQWMPTALRVGTHRGLSRLLSNRRLKIATGALQFSREAKRFANWFPMFADDVKSEILGPSCMPFAEGVESVFQKNLARCDASQPLDRMLYCDTKAWLADYLLLRGDKLTMANSLEARVPLLDHPLVEFAASLPTKLKLRGNTRKYLLKRYAERMLPGEIVHRPKQGFPIPIDTWLRTDANEMMHDLLSSDAVASRGLFNANRVESMIQMHESQKQDYATELWGIMSVEMWLRQFVDTFPQLATSSSAVMQESLVV